MPVALKKSSYWRRRRRRASGGSPFGAIVEYTAEVSEVDEHYKVGAPEDWKWPAGRIDQWGVSAKDVARTSVAERAFRFLPLTRR